MAQSITTSPAGLRCSSALVLSLAVASLAGCDAAPAPEPRSVDAPVSPTSPEPEPEPWSDAWLEAEATRYLDDPSFRRRALEDSLTNPDNQYSRKRLAAYALGDRGWDALPEWTPKLAPVTTAMVTHLRETGELGPAPTQVLWDGQRPRTLAQWVALGERVFHDYPLRAEIFARHALLDPSISAAVGLRADADQRWPGLVVFEDLDGVARVGITCALCHVGEDASGQLVPGCANRGLDYGRMRLAYHRDSGAPIPAELAARMAHWGPGRADITDDEDEDPVAIPDLWGVRELRHLTAAATLGHRHPAALAIRQETQLLHANRERARPPRELAWALAMYVYALEPPTRSHAPAGETTGAEIFARECRDCHSEANGSGPPIPSSEVGTDQALARGRARGTGLYRPAPLIRVAEAGPYLHDGSLASLDALLDEARLEPDYVGVRGRGAVGGHAFGLELSQDERDALLAYLRSL